MALIEESFRPVNNCTVLVDFYLFECRTLWWTLNKVHFYCFQPWVPRIFGRRDSKSDTVNEILTMRFEHTLFVELCD